MPNVVVSNMVLPPGGVTLHHHCVPTPATTNHCVWCLLVMGVGVDVFRGSVVWNKKKIREFNEA
jgi:hypothetical protein